jgi:hypothetical protein
LAYLDAANEREAAAYRRGVEAHRAAYVFAHNAKAYERWHREAARHPGAVGAGPGGGGLTGADLHRALMSLAFSHPDLVALRRPD